MQNLKIKLTNIFHRRRFCNDSVLIVLIYHRMWKSNTCISKYCTFYMTTYPYDRKPRDEVRISIEKSKHPAKWIYIIFTSS